MLRSGKAAPASSGATSAAPGAFSPFSHTAFALLWTATLISNVGTWMHDVGAGWLMTTLNPSPAVVTMVQAATTLPVFLFALFAGTLADRLDKRRMLITINIALTIIVSVLALLVWLDKMTPLLLILFTLAIGTGAAFMAPAWQAVVPQLIPREKLKAAIALNSMGINISRAIGPALAGVLIASVGLVAPFALNAASHLVIIMALLFWRPEATESRFHGPIVSEMATGLRHVRYNDALKATAVRAGAFFIFASAYWALLPLIARDAESGGSQLYGTLMGLIGTGAVVGALALPSVQKAIDSDRIVQFGTGGTISALLIMALFGSSYALMAAAFIGGVSWIVVLTSLNVSAQMALPNWVRARGLAVHLMVFFGSMAAGSILWGQLATIASIQIALIIAAIGSGVGVVVTRSFKVGQAESADLMPASLWPDAPRLAPGQNTDQRAMVTVEYQVDSQQRDPFLKAIRVFSKERLRDGATQWFIHESVESPGLWIESFLLPSWSEHLEQHKRVTNEDADAQAKLRAFDTRDGGPVVRHYLAPA